MARGRQDPERESVTRRLLVIGGFIVVLWLLEVLDFFVAQNLDLLGIHPRKWWGLPGILFAPLLHGGFPHLITNTTAILPLAFFVAARRERDLYLVTALVVFAGGISVWLFGSPGSVHIGASSLVFGYIGYLMFLASFERSLGSLALGALVLFLYGSLLFGLLPGQPGVSWESHFFGFASGGVAARVLGRRKVSGAPRGAPQAVVSV